MKAPRGRQCFSRRQIHAIGSPPRYHSFPPRVVMLNAPGWGIDYPNQVSGATSAVVVSHFEGRSMSNDSYRAKIAAALTESYKHRLVEGAACIGCGGSKVRLAMHVLKFAQSDSDPLPTGFVPMSASGGTVRGAFPVCDSCAPACPKCDLPELNSTVRSIHAQLDLKLRNPGAVLMLGNGVCKHVKFLGIRF